MSSPAHYEDPAIATDYRDRFSKSLARRISNRLELRMLRKAVELAGDSERMLDVPCGTGRLVTALLPHTRSLMCVDAARAMLDEARRRIALAPPASARSRAQAVRFVQGNACVLPFPDETFDVTVCWRLIHHFAAAADRQRLLRELARVSRHAIILSFWDAGTPRARHVARQHRHRPSGRVAIAREELAAEIAACGLKPERFYRLFGPLSVVGAVFVRV